MTAYREYTQYVKMVKARILGIPTVKESGKVSKELGGLVLTLSSTSENHTKHQE